MDRPTYSANWHRVSNLRPGLRPGVTVHRRHFGGRRGYVVHDPASNQFFRLDPVSYHLMALLDQKRTVEDAWLMTSERFGDAAPTQNEVVGLLSQMYYMNLLAVDAGVNGEQLFTRLQQRRHRQVQRQAASVMFWKIPLLDPGVVIDWLLPIVRPVLHPWALVAWAVLLVVALAPVGVHWEEFQYSAMNILRPGNLAWLAVVFIGVKVVHEFGHGVLCRHFGGEVHDMGIRILIFTPVPYCDATSSWAFANRFQRAMVAAAGIIIELGIAGIAALVWANTAPGPVHDLAYNTIFVAGVSSLLFNANPLLRYDGYYVLSDVLDIPNLFQRASGQVTYLVQRYVFGARQIRPVTHSRKEALWLLVYAAACWTYRVFVFAAILWFVTHQLFGLGILFGIMGFITWVIAPLAKFTHFLAASPVLVGKRLRGVGISVATAAAVVGLIGFLPVPEHLYSQAVVKSPDSVNLVMAADGFVESVLTTDGQVVEKNQPLIGAVNPHLAAERQELLAQVVELETKLIQATDHDPATVKAIQARIGALRQQVTEKNRQIERMSLRSPMAGVVVAPALERLVGRYVKRGEVVGQVRTARGMQVMAVLNHSQNASLFEKDRLEGIEIRPVGQPGHVVGGKVEKVWPAAQSILPHPALGYMGGGPVNVEWRDVTGQVASEPFFVAQIGLENDEALQQGQRVWVRFTLSKRPLAAQWWRKIWQVLEI